MKIDYHLKELMEFRDSDADFFRKMNKCILARFEAYDKIHDHGTLDRKAREKELKDLELLLDLQRSYLRGIIGNDTLIERSKRMMVTDFMVDVGEISDKDAWLELLNY